MCVEDLAEFGPFQVAVSNAALTSASGSRAMDAASPSANLTIPDGPQCSMAPPSSGQHTRVVARVRMQGRHSDTVSIYTA